MCGVKDGLILDIIGKIGTGGVDGVDGTGVTGVPVIKPKYPKQSTRKYICPCCGNSFRATKTINVMCMDCNKQFIVEEK